MDPSRLVVPADPRDPADDPDFVPRMWGVMLQPPELLVAGTPPLFHDVAQAVGKGSPATSLEELPRPLVSALPRFALQVLAQVLQALSVGVPSRLLTAVLQLCLAKKQPAWLVCNSRPVMLEPYLHRLETSVVQEQRMSRRERRRANAARAVPSSRQLSGQLLALACQLLLAGWVLQYGEVWSGNRDEAIAFCNPDHSGGEAPEELPSPWLQRFYDAMEVWVASPQEGGCGHSEHRGRLALAGGAWLNAAGGWRGPRGPVGEAHRGPGCASDGMASRYAELLGAPSCVTPGGL